jgi:predicted nucleic acid-binding Zn ribbon protein
MTRKIGKKSQPVAVSGLLDEIFQGKPLEKRLREGRIWMVWDSAVGTQIAAKARPVNFRDGVLTVMVSNAPWMQQLSFLKKGLIEKVNAALGEDLVREIFLKAGMPDRLQMDPRPAKKAARPLTAAETERIDKETADIDDPELREAIASLLTKHLSNTPEE